MTSKLLTRSLQLLLLIGLSLSIASCRVNPIPIGTDPTPPTGNPAGKQAPSLSSLRVIFDKDNSSVIGDNPVQPVLLKTNQKVTLFATFDSSTTMNFAQVFLIPADNSTAMRFDMTCNDKSECNYLWDLANPAIDKGVYSLTVRARNQEGEFGTIPEDYAEAFLVF